MKITILVFLALTSPLFAARSPAVEPVTGISIEEYREANPNTSKGYDFTKAEPAYERNSTADAELTTTTALFLILASALPFIVWFGVMQALPDAAPAQEQTPARPSFSVINGDGKPEDENSDDDHHLPKAS